MLLLTPAIEKYFKALAISSLHVLKYVGEGNLYLGPFHIIDRILESVILFKSPVTIRPASL